MLPDRSRRWWLRLPFFSGMTKIVYDPKRHCRVCRAFLPVDWSKTSPGRVYLSDLRRRAIEGCSNCDIILRGVCHFEDYWLDTGNGSTTAPPTSYSSGWEEHEIGISVISTEDGVEVTLTRPRRDSEGWDWLELEFYAPGALSQPIPAIKHAGDIPASSEADGCMESILTWIERCSTGHSVCQKNSRNGAMPTRLLDVSSDAVRLTRSVKPQEYIALSHSWGKKESRIQPMPTSTADNISKRERDIPWEELTKSFQDAVSITRRLGLRYLWIDSLCIIQDSAEDWAAEASRMSSIYENAHLVLSATRSRSGDDGLFSQRRPSYAILDDDGKATNISVKQKIEHRDFAAAYPATFETMPLFDRAWAFQERLLATRIVHYTERELIWECKERLWCECQGIELGRDWDSGKHDGNFKLDHARVLEKTDNAGERFKQWTMIVDQYTSRSLTFDSDRLPALSGVARRLHLPSMGRYLAGIYEHTLPHALLWATGTGIVEKGWRKRRPDEWRAPTWSWASVEAECGCGPGEDTAEAVCEILDVQCSLLTEDSYGRVSDGHLRLRAPCFTAPLVYSKLADDGSQYYDLRVGNVDSRMQEDVPLNESDTTDYLENGSEVLVAVVERDIEPRKANRRWFTGLAFRPSLRAEGAFERIGRFTHFEEAGSVVSQSASLTTSVPRELLIV
jgi:hypothetical protein